MFSRKEKAVAELVAREISNEEISKRLFIKVSEVRACKERIRNKLKRFDVKSDEEVIHFLKDAYTVG